MKKRVTYICKQLGFSNCNVLSFFTSGWTQILEIFLYKNGHVFTYTSDTSPLLTMGGGGGGLVGANSGLIYCWSGPPESCRRQRGGGGHEGNTEENNQG